jgi:hypothetical protein
MSEIEGFKVNEKILDEYDACFWTKHVYSAYLKFIEKNKMNIPNHSTDTSYSSYSSWHTFIQDALKQVLLFGYVVWYRLNGNIKVICGSKVIPCIKFKTDKSNGQIEHYLVVNNSSHYAGIKKNIMFFSSPEYSDDGIYERPNSYTYDVQTNIEQWLEFMDNMRVKDASNSRVTTIISQTERGLGNIRSQAQKNFNIQARDAVVEGGISDETSVEISTERHQANAIASKMILDASKSTINGRPVQLKTNDGYQIKETSSLSHERTIIIDTMDKLGYAIMQGMHVPPHVSGIMINNSDRNPSTKTTTNRVISDFDTHAEQFINFFNSIYKKEYGTRRDIITKAVSYNFIDRYKHIIKPEFLLNLISERENVNSDIFDLDAIKSEQNLVLGIAKKTSGGTDSMSYHSSDPRKRRHGDGEQSEVKVNARGKRYRREQTELEKEKTDNAKYIS